MKDYYQILGVEKTATADEIKKAYRSLAFKYHPDRNPGDAAAEEMFKKISEAYDVLGDESKKADYDRYGSADSAGTYGNSGSSYHYDYSYNRADQNYEGNPFQDEDTFWQWFNGTNTEGQRYYYSYNSNQNQKKRSKLSLLLSMISNVIWGFAGYFVMELGARLGFIFAIPALVIGIGMIGSGIAGAVKSLRLLLTNAGGK